MKSSLIILFSLMMGIISSCNDDSNSKNYIFGYINPGSGYENASGNYVARPISSSKSYSFTGDIVESCLGDLCAAIYLPHYIDLQNLQYSIVYEAIAVNDKHALSPDFVFKMNRLALGGLNWNISVFKDPLWYSAIVEDTAVTITGTDVVTITFTRDILDSTNTVTLIKNLDTIKAQTH